MLVLFLGLLNIAMAVAWAFYDYAWVAAFTAATGGWCLAFAVVILEGRT